MRVPAVPRVPGVPWVWFLPGLLVLVLGCNTEPATWKDLQSRVAGLEPGERDAAIEKFIAARGGTPIVENQTRLFFLVKDRDGVQPRVVGDFNGWAVTAQGYDLAIGKTTRLEGSSWSYLESSSYTNARPNTDSLRKTTCGPLSADGAGVCRSAIRGADAVLRREPRGR